MKNIILKFGEEFRQGDLSGHKLEKLPDNLTEIKHNGIFKLADSEISGNQHRLEVKNPSKMRVYQDEQGRYILDIQEETLFNHCDERGVKREHDPIIITGGVYMIKHEVEYSPFDEKLRAIRD